MLLITGRRDISTGISDTSTEVRRYWYVVKRVAMIESILQACSLPECQYDFVKQSNRKDKKQTKKYCYDLNQKLQVSYCVLHYLFGECKVKKNTDNENGIETTSI